MEKKEAPLLNRIEINTEVKYSGATPKKDEVKKKLAESLKVNEDLIFIKKIISVYGGNAAKVSANIYNTKEDLERVEKINKKKKEEKPEKPSKEGAE